MTVVIATSWILHKDICNGSKMSYVNLRGNALWSMEHPNNGEALVLLHGGLSATEDWDSAILPAVEKSHHVFSYDRTAHGRTKIREGYFHFDFQRDEAIAYLEDIVKEPAHLIGWSDGGIISLMVALKRPDLVRSLILIGTNYHFDCGLSFDLNTIEVSDEDKATFAERSGQNPELLIEVVRKAFSVWATEPTMTLAEISQITSPVLVAGGDDEPFSGKHTFKLYEALPNARLAIIPGASHYVIHEESELLQAVIKNFYLKQDFPITKYPNRRRKRQKEILNAAEA